MISLASLFVVLAGLAWTLPTAVDATCACGEVCPSYTGTWEIRSDCPPGGIMKCVTYLFEYSPICIEWRKVPEGGCVCNVFGCNCDGCACRSSNNNRRRLGRTTDVLEEEVPESCDDFDFYTSMTNDERRSYLWEKHCGDLADDDVHRAAQDIREILELLADSNQNGELSCAEFNDAHFDVDGLDLCGKLG